MKALILTSPTTSEDTAQSSIFYLVKLLQSMKLEMLDLSGMIDFYDPPEEMFKDQTNCSSSVFNENWIDKYIPECEKEYDLIYASALFSMDIILQGRYVKKCKEVNPKARAVIGGQAVKNLDYSQSKAVFSVFDRIFKGYLPIRPDYDLDLYKLKTFVTIATGTGCDWKKCRFCNNGKERYSLRNVDEVTEDFLRISEIMDAEVMLSSDSMPIARINELSSTLINAGNEQMYNLMMRADKGVNETFSRKLRRSGCSDVFIGGEILNDTGLALVNKGTTVTIIKDTAKNLSSSGIDVQLGLILFLPSTSERQLENQLCNLEEILPHVSGIEPESLSVLYNSEFYKNSSAYGICLYPEKNSIFPAWCHGLSPDIPWGFKDDADYFVWERHIDSLRQVLNGYVDEKYWWHVDYVKENWK